MTGSLADYGVSVVSDALDRLGLAGQVEGIHAVGPATTLCGPAFTIRMAPVQEHPRSVGDYIDDVPAGAIVCIDNGGRTDTTVWGGLLTFTAHAKKIGGTVIDGVCRDSEELQDVPYPLFAKNVHMRTGKDRVQAEEYNVVVSLGTARVSPGDYVLADRDGVVVVPVAALDRVLDIAETVAAAEKSIKAAVAGGQRLDEARREFGYHTLQTKQ